MLSYPQIYYQENKERLKLYQQEYYKENREKCIEKNKKWYLNEDNKEKQRAYYQKWLQNNGWKRTEKHICECGGKYTYHHQLRHNKSKRHQAYLESL